jgi:phage protein D
VLIQYVGKSPAPSGNVGVARAEHDFNAARARMNDLAEAAAATHDPNVIAEVHAAEAEVHAAAERLEAARAAAASAPAPATAEAAPEPEPLDLTTRLLTFSYEDSEKKTDLCKMTFDNRDLALFDDRVFEKGTVLIVSWGYAERMCQPHEVVVQKVKGALKLSIEAQDKGVLLNKKGRSRAFENMTRSAVVRQLAQENGYETARQHVDDTDIVYPVITQASQSDAQFMKKLADQEGFEFYVDVDGLHWHARKLDQQPMRVLQYYLPPDVGDIMAFDVENDVSATPSAVTVRGRDPVAKQDITYTASDSTTPRTTTATANAVPTVTVNPVTGEATTGTAPSGAVGAPTPPAAAAGTETRPTSEPTAAGARREADGVYRRSQQATVQLNIDMVGDPDIAAKSIVEVRGLGGRLSGKYFVTEAVHTIDGGGYKLKLKTKSDGTNKPGTTGAARTQPASAATPNPRTAPESATPNPAPGAAPPALQPTVTVDPRTGEERTTYSDGRGRGAT